MKIIVCIFVTFLCTVGLFGNNIKVQNATMDARDTVAKTRTFSFDLSWDNSWRNDISGSGRNEPFNWDAAWVFIKYLRFGKEFRHVTLSTDSSDHSAPLGCKIKPSPDGKGVFIYRSQNGNGSVNFQNIKLQWLYGNDFNDLGSENADSIVGFQIFAIEMVQIPQGDFYIGDPAGNGGPTECFYTYPNDGTYRISSEDSIIFGKRNGKLISKSTNIDSILIPSQFPKGFKSFYIMKYEGTNQQYVDFLNCLTIIQQNSRSVYIVADNPNGARGGIYKDGLTYHTSHPDRVIIDPRPVDVLAYYDWAGLRIMTELEFEKACRGNVMPVMNEYAWGSSTIHNTNSNKKTIYGNPTNTYEDGSETMMDSINSHIEYSSFFYKPDNSTLLGAGPLRAGIFAKSNTTRYWSGASYYGVLELTGNSFEFVENIYDNLNYLPNSYNGVHGDGLLTTNGNHDLGEILNVYGYYGIRGGSWVYDKSYGMIAFRAFLRHSYSEYGNIAIRGVRTSP